MREIVLDTETTGLSPRDGDRVVEIGCVELLHHMPTGQVFHVYVNPERPMPAKAFEIHGLGDDFLADKPVFADIADKLIAFLADAKLVIHNAAFDIGFLNAEFAAIGRPGIEQDRVIDTLQLAQRKHIGASNSLDALCRRYSIDNSRRDKHGALLDSELLAEVYIELIGGRQSTLTLVDSGADAGAVVAGDDRGQNRARPEPLRARLTDAERMAHDAFIETLGENAIWREIGGETRK